MEEAARRYAVRGWSVFPIVPRGKVPALPWKGFQERAASVEQVERWWQHRPDCNIGLVTGLVSGFSVLDYDPRNDPTGETLTWLKQIMASEPHVRTGGGGLHWYVRAGLASAPRLKPGLDFKSNGGYAIAPPSVHPSGNTYQQLREGVTALPAQVKDLLTRTRAEGAAGQSRTRQGPPDDALDVAQILALLQGVKPAGRGWLARCPAHDDRSPSLGVGEGRNGQPLLKCWTGCSFARVMGALRDRQSRQLVLWASRIIPA